MADTADVTQSPTELLAAGRRHLAVKEYTSAVETLAQACELLAKEHGDTADQCAEAYLWYGKSLLGLSREESGVLGDGVPGTGNADEEDDENEDEDAEEDQNGEAEADENGEAEAEKNGEATEMEKDNEASSTVQTEAESTTNDEAASSANEEPASSTADEPGPSNGEADVSMAAEGEEDVDNLQLAWEMLDLSRSILLRREQSASSDSARSLLAEVHLALGEVALESETYDKAVVDMQSCLELQKKLYGADDRRIAETHYQIGLANSLASNFEDAITHFKNAANILESRIKTLENPTLSNDASVKKLGVSDPQAEIKELKELLPEIQEKIQDMLDYKAETLKRVRETLCPSNGEGAIASSSSSSSSTKTASDISHLIKRKRKASDAEPDSSAKRPNTLTP